MSAPPTVHGLLLVHADLPAVRDWARRGLVPVRIEPAGPWTAVTPADALARSAAPYEDAVAALASRPLGPRLRPSIGLFVTGEVGVLTARGSGRRALQRWLLWRRETGPRPSGDLPPLRADDLAALVRLRGSGAALEDALRARRADPLGWLAGVHAALNLPRVDLLTGGASSRAELVEPDADSVRRFDHLAADELVHRAELADGR